MLYRVPVWVLVEAATTAEAVGEVSSLMEHALDTGNDEECFINAFIGNQNEVKEEPRKETDSVHLLQRLTPIAGKNFHGDFKSIVSQLRRPYYPLSKEEYEAVRQLAGASDVLLLDGREQVTFGEADGGFALMPLTRPI